MREAAGAQGRGRVWRESDVGCCCNAPLAAAMVCLLLYYYGKDSGAELLFVPRSSFSCFLNNVGFGEDVAEGKMSGGSDLLAAVTIVLPYVRGLVARISRIEFPSCFLNTVILRGCARGKEDSGDLIIRSPFCCS